MSEFEDTKKPESVMLADHERWYAAIGYLFFLCFWGCYFHSSPTFICMVMTPAVVAPAR